MQSRDDHPPCTNLALQLTEAHFVASHIMRR